MTMAFVSVNMGLGNSTLLRKLLVLALVFMVVCSTVTYGQEATDDTDATADDQVVQDDIPPPKRNCSKESTPCKEGMIIPMWLPQGNLSPGDKAARATVYFATLMFMFLGVSIISDRFMASIEVITSKEREVTVKKPNGETSVVNVRVWNETVSNLTLMALGSSAPEIMLSVIEIIGNNFEAGDLGPSTIVGSAAFNLFVIIGFCVYVIPDGEVRRIKHLNVFFVTATWSIFAYLWMYIIISVTSFGVIDVWEGVLTFIFFPVTVLTAYIADRKLFYGKFLKRRYRKGHKGVVVVGEGDMEMGDKGEEDLYKGLDSEDAEVREFEKHRRDYIETMRELRKKHPSMDLKKLEELAEYEIMNKGPKSRAFYRIQATRKLTGGGNIIKKKVEKKTDDKNLAVDIPEDDNITRIFFEPGHYTVMENVGTFQMTVARVGGNLSNTVYVDYRTEDGTANAGSDYEFAEGTLIFHPGDQTKQFSVTIIDDDIFEEDEHFYVRLSNIRVGDSDGLFTGDAQSKAQLANPSMATVMILDDDHSGIFHFEQKEQSIPESIGDAQIKVARSSGARGSVRLPYRTIEGTAHGRGKDYEDADGELLFENDQTEAYIKVRIIDDEEYEKNEVFYVELGEPILVSRGGDEEKEGEEGEGKKEEEKEEDKQDDDPSKDLGRPKLGDLTKINCIIRESMEFKSTVDKLLKQANLSLVVGTSSWREQFIEAITVSAGDDEEGGGDEEEGAEEGEEHEEKLPSCMDYVMHFLSIFWKVLFAFVPPTGYCGGWLCFWVSIGMIAVLTAFIGDCASSFGCSIGLKDAVCAISFVALGTSLPDTFASKVAAVGDAYADSSIGNVTGSNAVNVFLGIGIAWTMAALKHAFYGTVFRVDPGSLAFSVTVFCSFAVVAIIIMVIRRTPKIGGELGGPRIPKIITSCIFFSLWICYVMLSSLESYCDIKGF